MINAVWLFLLAGGVVCGISTDRCAALTESALGGAETAVELSFKLIGVMCLWLGIMRIAEKAGILSILARLLRPLLRWLFPSVPSTHPAMGAIVMTISANMLGMGNAATPFGMQAMQKLQSLNRDTDGVTPAMCTFLALCTAGVNLVPSTIIALRSAAGSSAPGQALAVTVAVSLVTMICVIVLDRVCRSLYFRKVR